MSKSATLNIRVDSDIKESAGAILNNMGLTFSEAFNLMLHQIHLKHAIPFEINDTERDFVPGAAPNQRSSLNESLISHIDRIERGEADILGPFNTFEDYKASLYSSDDELR
jgi:addiction module RelB/DinJ family antitoxin